MLDISMREGCRLSLYEVRVVSVRGLLEVSRELAGLREAQRIVDQRINRRDSRKSGKAYGAEISLQQTREQAVEILLPNVQRVNL